MHRLYDRLFENISKIEEADLRGIKRKQKSTSRLFPEFQKRVKSVGV